MIVTEILGNVTDSPEVTHAHIEAVYLDGTELVKRIQRVTTDHNREIGLRLAKDAPDLKDGDILLREEGERTNLVVVKVNPTDVLVISPASITQMGFVAHSLGNRHLPAQFFDASSEYGAEVMVVAYDHTVEDFLTHHAIAFSRQERVMPVPFRHAEHSH